jgi:hypothetical protein
MKRKTFLDLVRIPTPCEKLWDEMLGDEKIRHCIYCDKDVHNLSEISSKEAEKLIFKSKGRVCVRMTRDESGKIVTSDQKYYQIKRKTKFAASVLSVTLALTSIALSQAQTVADKGNKQTISKQQKQKLLTLRIADENNGAISKAFVKITSLDTKEEQTANTDENGEAKFVIKNLGKYEIFISNAVGFKELRKVVDLNSENVEINLKLEVKESDVGTIVTADSEIEIGTTESKVGTTITLGGIQKLPEIPKYPSLLLIKPNKTTRQTKTSQISFTIYDPNDAVIPNAGVKLTHEKTKQEFIVYTNQDGVAYFLGLPHGRYNVEATKEHFIKSSMTIEVKEEVEPNIKMHLSVGMIVGDIRIDWYEVPIFNSIVQKDYDFVKNYIASGKNINIKDKNGVTLLHVAAKRGNFELIKLLIDAGANVNAKDKNGETPILNLSSEEETKEQWFKTFKLFIEKGADVNVQGKNEDTETLLMKFCDDNETTAEDVKVLLNAGADVNLKNSEGETALMFACDNNNLEVVKLLLEAKANPNFKDEDGETAMMKTKSEEIKDLLKKYGAKK